MMEDFTVYNEGRRIVGTLNLPVEEAPLVVACHGFYSSKESKKYIQMEEGFSKAGLGVLRFDFRGCGGSDGRFEDTTLSGRLSDLGSILDSIEPYTGRVGLLGSSFGGCVALLASARRETVKATVALSTPFHLEEVFRESMENGRLYESPMFKVKREFWDDLKNYDMKGVARKVSHLLVIHGTSDELVPSYHAKDLYDSAQEPKRLEMIEGADHRFTDPRDRGRMIDLSLKWFKTYLNSYTNSNSAT
jgi:alpha/beta superfamily hydrolase